MPKSFKKGFKKRYGKTMSTAKLTKKVNKITKTMPKMEIKFSFVQDSASLTTSFTYGQPCEMKQGTAQGTRAGSKIRVLGIDYTGYWNNQQTNGQVGLVRAFIGVDRATNGSNPSQSQFLMTSASAGGRWTTPFDPRLANDRHLTFGEKGKAYTVLKHIRALIFPVGGPTTASTQGIAAGHDVFRFHLRMKCNIEVVYDGNAGDVTDIIKNNVFSAALDASAIVVENSQTTVFYIDEV